MCKDYNAQDDVSPPGFIDQALLFTSVNFIVTTVGLPMFITKKTGECHSRYNNVSPSVLIDQGLGLTSVNFVETIVGLHMFMTKKTGRCRCHYELLLAFVIHARK